MAASAPVLGDLLKINQHLIVACYRHGCRHEVRLSAVEAVTLLGAEATLAAAARRLVCRRCGARGRRKEVGAWPCSLDQAAWDAREERRRGVRNGEDGGRDLDGYLATLAKLARGRLGGDGPVGAADEAPQG